jgi:serine O-acetyltransferase
MHDCYRESALQIIKKIVSVLRRVWSVLRPSWGLAPNKRAERLYRLSNWLYRKGIPLLPIFFMNLNALCHGIEIHYATKIGRNLKILHSRGIVIGRNAVIGNNVKIYSGVVLGVKIPNSGEQPIIEDNAILGTGAKILGDITVGQGAVVGANAVVLNDVPPGAVAVGIPAKLVN